ncbi:MAG: NAD(P)/FAD-dependent oxidoreductase [Brevirhabdus sp.]
MTRTLIIGGGIAGISAAARLSALGPTTVLEAEDALGYHASGRSAAMFLRDYGNDTVRALNAASEDELSDCGVLSPRGMMLVARPEDAEDFETEHHAFGMERITRDEAISLVPILDPERVHAAGFRADAHDLDTDLLLQGYARTARSNGADIETGAQVTAIRVTERGWEVDAAGQTYRADRLVNAAGAWADRIAELAGVTPIGVQPYRRSMARLPAPGGHDVRGWPFMDGVNERWYAKPDAGKWLVSPSDEDPMPPHDAWADDLVLAEGLARYEEMVTEPVTRLETNWAGLRSFAPDRALVIGAAKDAPGFWWLAGQGGYGFQTSPAASRLLADLVTGATPELPDAVVAALSPQRFA